MDNLAIIAETQVAVIEDSVTDLTVTNLSDTPFVGQIFPNLEACHSFYCLYARRLGFDVSKVLKNCMLIK